MRKFLRFFLAFLPGSNVAPERSRNQMHPFSRPVESISMCTMNTFLSVVQTHGSRWKTIFRSRTFIRRVLVRIPATMSIVFPKPDWALLRSRDIVWHFFLYSVKQLEKNVSLDAIILHNIMREDVLESHGYSVSHGQISAIFPRSFSGVAPGSIVVDKKSVSFLETYRVNMVVEILEMTAHTQILG